MSRGNIPYFAKEVNMLSCKSVANVLASFCDGQTILA